MSGTITVPALSGGDVIWRPRQTIEIGGVERYDVKCEVVARTIGTTASVVQLKLEQPNSYQRAMRRGDKVRIWIGRELGNPPVFIGYVRGIEQGVQPVHGKELVYTAVGVADTLEDGTCSRDFNRVTASGMPEEALSLREVVQAIHAEYAAEVAGTKRVALALHTFPTGEVGEVAARGQTWGSMIEQLVGEAGDGDWRVYVDYEGQNTAILKCYRSGTGKNLPLVLGTDSTSVRTAQPYGVATVERLSELENDEAVVNVVVAEGARKLFEQAVPVGPAFDPTLLAEVEDRLNGQLTGKAQDLSDLLEDPRTELFGRVWALPLIEDEDGVSRQLEATGDLLQAGLGGALWQENPPKGPLLIYRWSSTATDPIVVKAGTGTRTSATEITIQEEDAESDRWEGYGMIVGGQEVTIATQDGGDIVTEGNMGGSNGEVSYQIIAGRLDTWRVKWSGVEIDGGEVILDEPLMAKLGGTSDSYFPVILDEIRALNLYGGYVPALTNKTAYAAGLLDDAADGSQEVWFDTPVTGASAQVSSGNPTGSTTLADLAVGNRDRVWVDSPNGKIWRAIPAREALNSDAAEVVDNITDGKWNVTSGAYREVVYVSTAEVDPDAWRLPEEVYVQATWVSEEILTAESDKQGTETGIERERRIQLEGFVKKTLRAPYFVLEASGFYDGKPGDVTATYEGSTDDEMRDDTARLKAQANKRAKQTAEAMRAQRHRLPDMPLGIDPGRLVTLNGRNIRANVTEVAYFYGDDDFATELVVAGQ